MNKKPNIILITVDCLRADHLGFMGYQKNISPNIDALSEESTVFSQAFSTGPSTPYSFPAILTSTYPLDYQGPHRIEKPRVLVSEVFKEQGYITAAFHANPFLSRFFGYNKGWDYFEDTVLPTGQLEKKNMLRDFLRKAFKNVMFSISPKIFFKIKYLKYLKKEAKVGLKIKATTLNNLIREFIQSVKDEEKPFFLWVHYMDVHGPYLSRENYYQEKPYSFNEAIAGQYINYLTDYSHKGRLKNFLQKYFQETINLYDQGIECLDRELGKLLDFLKDEGVYQNTVVCLTADHGEELFEHQEGISHFNCKLYNELLHVPLLIKVSEEKKEKIDRKVSLIDLAPTLCSLAGVKIPPSFKGKNLFGHTASPLFHQAAPHIGDIQSSPAQVQKKLNQYNIAYQSDNWKYILNQSQSSEELYNLNEDLREQINIARSRPEVISEMRKKLREFKLTPLVVRNKTYDG